MRSLLEKNSTIVLINKISTTVLITKCAVELKLLTYRANSLAAGALEKEQLQQTER